MAGNLWQFGCVQFHWFDWVFTAQTAWCLKRKKKNTERGTRGFFLMNSPHPPCASLNLKIYKIKRGKISSKISFETSKARAGITKIPGKPLLEWPSRSQKNNKGFIHIKLGWRTCTPLWFFFFFFLLTHPFIFFFSLKLNTLPIWNNSDL